jgi:hypothetical protein
LTQVNIEARRSGRIDWFFYEEHAMRACTTREEMLRALKDEIPAQVRQADNIEGVMRGYWMKRAAMSRGRSFHAARISKIRASQDADEAGTST